MKILICGHIFAIPDDNPEIVKAKALNIPIIQRAEMLARLMKKQKAICVAGPMVKLQLLQ